MADDESYVVLKIRRDGGCQIQVARVVEINVGKRVDEAMPATVLFTQAVKEWREPAAGIWFPKQVPYCNHGQVETACDEHGYFMDQTITSLTINADQEPHWLAFQFPDNALVLVKGKESDAARLLGMGIGWGA